MSDDKSRIEEEMKAKRELEQKIANEQISRLRSSVAGNEEEDEDEKEDIEGEEISVQPQPKTKEEIMTRLKAIGTALSVLVSKKNKAYKPSAELLSEINQLESEQKNLSQDLIEMEKRSETEMKQKEEIKRRSEKQVEVEKTLANKAKESPESGVKESLMEQIRKRRGVKESVSSPKKTEEVSRKSEPKKIGLPNLSPSALQRLSVLKEKGNEEEEEWEVAYPKEPPKETPSQPPKEIPSQPPKEIPREIPKEIPRETPQEIPKEIPREIPKEIPRETPQEIPKDKPKENITDENKESRTLSIQRQTSLLKQSTLAKREVKVEGDYETLKNQHVRNAINTFLNEFKDFEKDYTKHRSLLKKIGDALHLTLIPEARKTQVNKLHQQLEALSKNPDEKTLAGFKTEVNNIIKQIHNEPQLAGRSGLLGICERMLERVEKIEIAILETDNTMKGPSTPKL